MAISFFDRRRKHVLRAGRHREFMKLLYLSGYVFEIMILGCSPSLVGGRKQLAIRAETRGGGCFLAVNGIDLKEEGEEEDWATRTDSR